MFLMGQLLSSCHTALTWLADLKAISGMCVISQHDNGTAGESWVIKNSSSLLVRNELRSHSLLKSLASLAYRKSQHLTECNGFLKMCYGHYMRIWGCLCVWKSTTKTKIWNLLFIKHFLIYINLTIILYSRDHPHCMTRKDKISTF